MTYNEALRQSRTVKAGLPLLAKAAHGLVSSINGGEDAAAAIYDNARRFGLTATDVLQLSPLDLGALLSGERPVKP
jgi:hypothetical protein